MKDIYFSYLMLWVFVTGASLYGLRLLVRGRAKSSRADKDGGSALLGKPVIEWAYWVLRPFVSLLLALRVTPNGITLFSLVPGVVAGVALSQGWFGAGCVFATLAAFCDTLDGILARKLGTGSDAGETLDAVIDRCTEFLFMGGLIVYYRFNIVMEAVTILALLGAFLVSYTTAKAEAMGVKPPRGAMRRAERSVYLGFATGLTPFCIKAVNDSWPFYLRQAPIVFVIGLIAVVANVSVGFRTAAIMRSLRERDAARNAEAASRGAA